MHCPYGTAEQEARMLRCGQDSSCGRGPAQRVYVLGYGIDDPELATRLDQVALAGGDSAARMANTASSLRTQLEMIFDEIGSQN